MAVPSTETPSCVYLTFILHPLILSSESLLILALFLTPAIVWVALAILLLYKKGIVIYSHWGESSRETRIHRLKPKGLESE